MTPDRAIAQALEQAQRGQRDAAIAALRRLVQREPRSVQGHQALGDLLLRSGRVDQGLYMLRRGVELAPGNAAARNNLGVALMGSGRPELWPEALQEFRESVRLDPAYVFGWHGVVTASMQLRRLQDAAAAARRLLALRPAFVEARVNPILAMVEAGDLEEAISALREALALAPDHLRLRGVLLMALNSSDRASAEDVAAAHREYGAHARPAAGAAPARTSPDPERRLRVSFLSGDFLTHSVMFFLEPLLARLDRGRHEVACISTGAAGDAATTRARSMAEWIDAAGLDDRALDRRIREAGIDVLVELGGHTPSSRLPAMASKPAPLIFSAIGYPNTTGLPAVDYRIVDSLTDPAGAERFATERLVRLDPCFLCYRPPADAPPVGPLPCASGGCITFGSFNAATKLSPSTLRAWAGVLASVPGAHLIVKAAQFDDPGYAARLRRDLEALGVETGRVEVFGQLPSIGDHLGLYQRIDIALDSFPYNGTTTTCEALWMGVPVVTIAGDRHAARVGVSLLTAVGLPELIAPDAAGLAALAVGLAADPLRLAALRAGMRDRLRGSALCDEGAYAVRWAAAVREAWREWCRDQG